MDPNETLSLIRARVANLRLMERNNLTTYEGISFEEAALELADLCDALDDWITKGGFVPADWSIR